jgi:uncharacterized membrane protein YbhN (UPF0104 family)
VHGPERTQPSAGADTQAAPTPAGPEPTPAFVHSPEFLARLIVFALLFVVTAGVVRVFDRTFAGLQSDVGVLEDVLPAATGPLLTAAVTTLAIVIISLGLVGARSSGGFRAAVTGLGGALAAGGLIGAVLSTAGTRGWLGDPDMRPGVPAVVAGAVALLVIEREQLPVRARRAGWWLLVVTAVLSTLGSRIPVDTQLVSLIGAAVVGAAVALAAGTPSRAPTAAAVRSGLERLGLRIEEVAPVDVDARASVPWRARSATGRDVFVKTRSSEERSADLLFRIWRVLRLRGTGDALPEASLRRAVEHEAFVATRAAAVGVRTPRLVGVGRLEDGVFAAYEALDAETFEDAGDRLGPAALRSAWSMCRALHRAGMAHRDLRAANLLLDGDGEVWIVDFGFAEVAAPDKQMRHDEVELLASTAAVVGVEAAVGAAVDVLGPHALDGALPYVQPAAVSVATRKALGKSGFDELRRALAEAIGAPEPEEEPRLERIRLKTVLTLVALGAALWVLLPQIARQSELWPQIVKANPGWVAAALVAAALTYVAAAVSMVGAAPGRVPFGPAVAAQVASSFTNRITPASVGSLALNTRFLARTGTGTAAAATAVGLSTSAGFVAHGVITVFAVAWAGSAGLGDLTLPEPRTLLLTGGVIGVLVALGLAVPASRRFLVDRLRGPLRQSFDAVREVAHSPRRLAMLFGGSAFVTLANLAALSLSLQALGASVALSTVAVVYLAGAAIGSAAPTPGGLGALEAALVAGLVAASVDQGAALAAVLVFRLVTFWLPILPGWGAFVLLQRKGWL